MRTQSEQLDFYETDLSWLSSLKFYSLTSQSTKCSFQSGTYDHGENSNHVLETLTV